MAWKTVSGGNVIDLKKGDGEPVVGIFKGHKNITTKIGEQVIWQFLDDEGVPFGVYGFTNLNRAMESVKLESLCRLTYKGTQNLKTKYGMKDVHQVLVEFDSDEEMGGENDASKIPF